MEGSAKNIDDSERIEGRGNSVGLFVVDVDGLCVSLMMRKSVDVYGHDVGCSVACWRFGLRCG